MNINFINTTTISGKVHLDSGQTISRAKIRLVADLATLGRLPGAVASLDNNFNWTNLITDFTGHRWNAYTKFIARQVAGLTFVDFKEQVVEYNPSLVETGYVFQADRSYLLPKQRPTETSILWDREITGFKGNRWNCWQQYVAGKVPGLTWTEFKEQVTQQNPILAEDDWSFVANRSYRLPRNPSQQKYEVLVISNGDGEYKIENLPFGHYQATISAAGLLSHTQEISVAGDQVLDFTLKQFMLEVVAEKPGFVAVRPGSISFWLNGQQIRRFIGLNLTLLPHYGQTYRQPNGNIKKVLEGSKPEHRDNYLERAKELRAKVIRCFLPHHGVPNDEIANRFEKILTLAKDRDLYILPALIDFYHNRGAFPDSIHPDDQTVYKESPGRPGRLTSEFFLSKHETLFMPFVEFIVEKFRNHELGSRIFAWEIGNELKWDDKADQFVNFMLKIAGQIKTLDPTHMVTTGMKSTQHAGMFEQPTLTKKLYGSDLIDFITVHSYVDKVETDTEKVEFKGIEDDATLARMLGKPLLVEETGVVKQHNPDPQQAFKNHLAHWFDKQGNNDDKHQAYGYMQWGFDPDGIGDGDGKLWNEFDPMSTIYKQRADQLQPI